jgi:hypothetical protein
LLNGGFGLLHTAVGLVDGGPGLRDLLIENPGAIPVTFEVRDGEKTHRIRTRDAYSVELGRDLVASIESLLGAGTVKERLVPLPS